MTSIPDLITQFIREVLAESRFAVHLAYVRSDARRLLRRRAREALPQAIQYLENLPLPETGMSHISTQEYIQGALAILIVELARQVLRIQRAPYEFPLSTWLLNWGLRSDTLLPRPDLTDRDAALTRGRAVMTWM